MIRKKQTPSQNKALVEGHLNLGWGGEHGAGGRGGGPTGSERAWELGGQRSIHGEG
jgi:hypothetical protein